MIVERNFKSFFEALKVWKLMPFKFRERPKIPQYKHKAQGRNLLVYTVQAISKTLFRKGLVKLSKTGITIKTRQQKVAQARVVPRYGCYIIEIIYEKEVTKTKLDKKLYAGVDTGLNNLGAVTSNKKGFAPFLVNGRPLKSINQFYNKQKACFQSLLPKGRRSSKRLQRLTLKRNCRVDDYLHKASRIIVDRLVKEGIGNLVIGKNDNWKQSVNMGKRNNQNFVQVPHARFIEMLTYKAKLEGIKVVVKEEGYTSKCSFLDNESVRKHLFYSGKRIKRGLFRTAKGLLINADVNASYNIIKKVAPKAFAEGLEAVVVQPYGYFSIK